MESFYFLFFSLKSISSFSVLCLFLVYLSNCFGQFILVYISSLSVISILSSISWLSFLFPQLTIIMDSKLAPSYRPHPLLKTMYHFVFIYFELFFYNNPGVYIRFTIYMIFFSVQTGKWQLAECNMCEKHRYILHNPHYQPVTCQSRQDLEYPAGDWPYLGDDLTFSQSELGSIPSLCPEGQTPSAALSA